MQIKITDKVAEKLKKQADKRDMKYTEYINYLLEKDKDELEKDK